MPFSFRPISKSQVIALSIVLINALTALGLSARRWRANPTEAKPVVATTPQVKNKVKPLGKGYLQRKGIWPQLRPLLDAHGDRWEKPGQERLILTGTMESPARAGKIPVQLILEFPDKARLEKQIDGKQQVTIFDGKSKFKLGEALSPEEADELESLVLDSADHFLAGHMQGFAFRHLGTRFRLDDGSVADYKGPYYDIYQMTDQLPQENEGFLPQNKRFYVNSDTQLLERVSYQLTRNGRPVEALVQYAGWQKERGQQIQNSITRTENGKPAFELTVNAIRLSPRADDGIFTKPTSK
jgi:hypothetical protein